MIGTIIAIVVTVTLAGATVAAIDGAVGKAGTVSATGAMGETLVSEQNIAYTVSAVTCGIPAVGTGGLETTAQGQFCEVDVTVANQSSDVASFSPTMVTGLIGTSEYTADSTAGIGDDSSLSYEQINPGNSVMGKVYIDIPAGAALESVQLDDGVFGAAVEFAVK